MPHPTPRPRSVNQSDEFASSGNGQPDREPDGTADTNFDPAALDAPTPTQQPSGPDPFDPASLRIANDFNATIGVKRVHLTIRAKKPEKTEWVRAHPDPARRLQTLVIEVSGERGSAESYLVAPHLRNELAAEPTLSPKLYVTAVSVQGTPFLWECKLPKDDRETPWHQSMLAAVDLATKGWVRVAANMRDQQYDVWQATGKLPEPQWPGMSFRDMLRLAFKDRFIDSLDHPVLRRLRGEA
jgi:hypothetical protein